MWMSHLAWPSDDYPAKKGPDDTRVDPAGRSLAEAALIAVDTALKTLLTPGTRRGIMALGALAEKTPLRETKHYVNKTSTSNSNPKST
ncbi:hypothetical protein PGT21_037260 [Puccinia graminis f. sp. tritici]|uniref:Uncharacterized protein n=1 Tax=Puccinia graminis f. sp. tritici TaxID=56615 RepID=A0A5B0R4I9_PUCGR|nr:hypothetical protein PGT21_037260 [Puccinia graminis f. sp. tritici]